MAEDVGIVMSLYDKVSPTLKAIAGNSRAFDKSLDELEASLKAYEKAQDSLVTRSSNLKKALAETDQKVKDAQKSYKKLKDETSKGALDAAIEEQGKLRQELKETETAIKSNDDAYKALYRSANEAASAASKADNRAGSQLASGGASETGMLAALGKAGILSMAGDAVGQWADAVVGSALGGDAGSMASGALSGAASGAALGSIIPGIGTAVGAALGGAIGLAGGAAQTFQNRDAAFKDYYGGLYDTSSQATAESLKGGSATAGQRELDAIAFNRLLGEGRGDQYLEDLRVMAAATPMEYGDLTGMSRALATGFGDSPERMLELMGAIGDAGSAVGVTASDMTEMARAMSRMNASGKATLEFLNIFQDRGVDAIGMLGEAMGKTQGEVYDLISKGKINGRDAADILQRGLEDRYSGAMEVMAKTFEGLTSTLSDTMAEIDNAGGERYNATRSAGLQKEIDAYGGALGDVLSNLNGIIGDNTAYLENLGEQYKREALSAVFLGRGTTVYSPEDAEKLKGMGGEYRAASFEYEQTGSRDAALTMERLKNEAEALATAAYESSDQYQAVVDAQLDSIDAIRENTAGLEAATNAYRLAQEREKGGLSVSGWVIGPQPVAYHSNGLEEMGRSHAYGLERVPYDGYAALLHQDERVLTAREARAADRDGGPGGGITIQIGEIALGGGTTEEDARKVAQIMMDEVVLRLQAGAFARQ